MDERDDDERQKDGGSPSLENVGLAGWIESLSSLGLAFVDRVGEDFWSGEEGAELASRFGHWWPVFEQAKGVLEAAFDLGRYLADRAGEQAEAPPEELVEALRTGTSQLLSEFPSIADIYDDVQRIDEELADRLDRSGGNDALLRYLDWLRGLIDAVVGHLVELAFSEADYELTPQRLEVFLERLDQILEQALDRWVVGEIVEPGPKRSRRNQKEPEGYGAHSKE